MAFTEFQLVDNQTFLPEDIVDGNIFVSPDQFNGTGTDLSTGIQVIVDYHDLKGSAQNPQLQGVVEGRSSAGGQFFTVAYQFGEFSRLNKQEKRQILMSPTQSVQDAGTDNIIFVGGSVIEQISEQTGTMPAIWRLRIAIRDLGGTFVSVRLSVYGQRFNTPALPNDFRGILTDTSGDRITDGGNIVGIGVN